MNAAEAAAFQRRDHRRALARLADFRGRHPFAVSKRRFWTHVATAAHRNRLAILTAYLARRRARPTVH